MIRSLKALCGYPVEGSDVTFGKITDFFLDASTLQVQHVKIDTGHWFYGRYWILPAVHLTPMPETAREVSFDLTRVQAAALSRHASSFFKHKKEEEHQVDSLYSWASYTGGGALFNSGPTGTVSPETMVLNRMEKAILDQSVFPEQANRFESFKNLLHYQVEAIDSPVGYLCDLQINDQNWKITTLEIQDRLLFPTLKLSLPVGSVERLDLQASRVDLSVIQNEIRENEAQNP